MFRDYQSLVLQYYREKKDDNTISQRLKDPTPAQLKEECVAVCVERYNKKDEQLLRDFFGKQDDGAAYVRAIGRHETDKFKPLVKFLRGQVGTPGEKYIELLAWLIDFDRRPFKLGEQYENEEEVVPQMSDKEEIVMIEPAKTPETGMRPMTLFSEPAASRPAFKIKYVFILIPLVIAVGALGYWISNISRPVAAWGKEGCMYWAGDRYERIPCQKFKDTLVIAYDSITLHSFRKINDPDTITDKAIGKVWYIKINNNIEFYTSDGFHPIQVNRKLKPLTEYIIYKYLRHN